jgi:hypothetical protein
MGKKLHQLGSFKHCHKDLLPQHCCWVQKGPTAPALLLQQKGSPPMQLRIATTLKYCLEILTTGRTTTIPRIANASEDAESKR